MSIAVCHYIDGLAWLRRVRGIDVCDGEGAEHGGGALRCRAGDGALGGAIAEIDVDDAHGLEGAQCFGGGEIEAWALSFFSMAR